MQENKRGPERLRPDDGSRIMSIKFRPKDYAKLRCLSLDQDKTIKSLILDAIRIAYGPTTDEEMNRIYGTGTPKVSRPVVETIHAAPSWNFSADTMGQTQGPAKPSTIPPPVLKKEASLKEASDKLWEMLNG